MSKVDIVIPWVDGSDPEWVKSYNTYYNKIKPDKKSNSGIRYESWDNLQYLFRAIEKFMPWYNNIYLITWGHVPKWLDINNPRLKIVKHEDYIPEEYLPTFNSNVIELNLHRIKELQDNYIIFNDDLFPLQNIEKEYYFVGDMPCDEAVEGIIFPVDIGQITRYSKNMQINNMLIINKYFNKREVQEKHYDKWYYEGYGEILNRTKSLSYWYDFSGFHDPHMANALKKSTLAKLWELEKDIFEKTSKSKFRHYENISWYLVRYWQFCTGEFVPRKTLGKSYLVTPDNYLEVVHKIENQEEQMISINEDCTPEEFEVMKKAVNEAFESILPDKCSFEI